VEETEATGEAEDISMSETANTAATEGATGTETQMGTLATNH